MSHLLGLNVNVVMLNSVMKSPPGGTDRGVSDFMVVDSQLGTQEEFDNLLKELHDRGESGIYKCIPYRYIYLRIIFLDPSLCFCGGLKRISALCLLSFRDSYLDRHLIFMLAHCAEMVQVW